jgi:endonuclease/exonuclease/phosphatase family metal-dependent hydrolase
MNLPTRILIILFLSLYGVSILHGDDRINPIDTIRVMTYNIHTGVGVDGKFDLARIARLITNHRIDIAGLQEVDQGVERTGRVRTMEVLSELTGMNFAFGKAITFQGGEYGNGILSRYPMIEKRNHRYAFDQTGEHRALICVLLKYQNDTLLVMNTHLDHRPDDTERMKSVEEILSIAAGHLDRLLLLLGDINDVPQSRVINRLREQFRDAWEDAGEGTGYTFHTDDLNRRIDYILYHDSSLRRDARLYFKAIRAYTIQTPASDHLPVVTEFEVYMN